MKKKVIISALLILMIVMSSFVCAKTVTSVVGKPGPSLFGGETTVNKLLGIFQWIGYAIAVGMLIYVGIKYVLASADGKADLKSSMTKYVIGALAIAGADAIFGWIMAMAIK